MTDPTPYQSAPDQRYTPPQYQSPVPVENPAANLQSVPTQPQFTEQPYSVSQTQYASPQYAVAEPEGYASVPAGVTGETNKLALASVTVSGASVFGSLLLLAGIQIGVIALFILPLIGAILGHFALHNIKQRGGGNRGMALTGMILGWAMLGLQLVVMVGLLVVAMMIFSALSG